MYHKSITGNLSTRLPASKTGLNTNSSNAYIVIKQCVYLIPGIYLIPKTMVT